MRATMVSGGRYCGQYLILAMSDAKKTSAETKPGNERTPCSMSQEQAEHQKGRRYQVGQDADVGVGEMRQRIQQQQQEKGKHAPHRNHQPR